MDPWHVVREDGNAPGGDLERGCDRGNKAGAPFALADHEPTDAFVAGRGRAETLCDPPEPSPDSSRRAEVFGAGDARDKPGIDCGRELHSVHCDERTVTSLRRVRAAFVPRACRLETPGGVRVGVPRAHQPLLRTATKPGRSRWFVEAARTARQHRPDRAPGHATRRRCRHNRFRSSSTDVRVTMIHRATQPAPLPDGPLPGGFRDDDYRALEVLPVAARRRAALALVLRAEAARSRTAARPARTAARTRAGRSSCPGRS